MVVFSAFAGFNNPELIRLSFRSFDLRLSMFRLKKEGHDKVSNILNV